MKRFRRPPANMQLRRAQLTFMLAILIPTVLMIAAGIVLLAVGSRRVSIIVGLLVLVLCTTAVTGYILGTIFVSRGAALAQVQNDYLSSVSHELRTPLTSIKMFIETLRNEDRLDPNEKQKCLDLLMQEMTRVEELVNRMLDLGRMKAEGRLMVRSPVPVDALFTDAVSSFHAATMSSPTEIVVHQEPDLVVLGDRHSLAMALTNLLTNAWKYAEGDDKLIELSARASGDRSVEVTVRDNGPGIPQNEQRDIFEQFERGAHAIASGASGSGLGLAIVRAVVQAHKGRVDVHSVPGKGSTFRVKLRRARKAA